MGFEGAVVEVSDPVFDDAIFRVERALHLAVEVQ